MRTTLTDYGHLDHAYVGTSHASQGATVNTVLVAMGRDAVPAMSREQFYVTVSRGAEAVRVYTDDKATVRDAIGVSSHRGSATELLGGQLDRRGLPRGERKAALAETLTQPKPEAQPLGRSERMKRYTHAMARHVRQRAMEHARELVTDELGAPSHNVSRVDRQGIMQGAERQGLQAHRHAERIEQERMQATLSTLDRITIKMQPPAPPEAKPKAADHQPKGVSHAAKLGS